MPKIYDATIRAAAMNGEYSERAETDVKPVNQFSVFLVFAAA